MRAIWKGAISFGLVNIPVSLFPALKREELSFHMLRASDHSRISYKRVAEADGKEVPWDQIVKGYEYEKGRYVVLKDDDFARIDIEATQTVDIMRFVKLEEVSPLLFNKPYYMEPVKTGAKAYSLLREALVAGGKIGIAEVVIKTRRHLAAIKPQNDGLILELMHYPADLRPAEEYKLPANVAPGREEMKMARALIDNMTAPWRPEEYEDRYKEDMEKLIEEKVKHQGDDEPTRPARKKAPSNVIDLVAVLKQSLAESEKKAAAPAAKKAKIAPKAAVKSKTSGAPKRKAA